MSEIPTYFEVPTCKVGSRCEKLVCYELLMQTEPAVGVSVCVCCEHCRMRWLCGTTRQWWCIRLSHMVASCQSSRLALSTPTRVLSVCLDWPHTLSSQAGSTSATSRFILLQYRSAVGSFWSLMFGADICSRFV